MKQILSIIFILSTFTCHSQTNELANAPTLEVDAKSMIDELPKTDYPESSWGSCMNNAGRACSSSWLCSAGYALTPAAYILGWSIGCAIYDDISRVVESIEELPKDFIEKKLK